MIRATRLPASADWLKSPLIQTAKRRAATKRIEESPSPHQLVKETSIHIAELN
jgi:hypothetical protein